MSNLKKWFQSGEAIRDEASKFEISCMSEEFSTVAGTILGGTAGTNVGIAFGESIGWWVGEQLDSIFDSEDSKYAEQGETLGRYFGGAAGYLAGAKLGQHVAKEIARITIANIFGANSKPSDALDQCFQLLEIPENAVWSEVMRAYREKARIYHPDKGGTQEQMLKLNICRELLKMHINQ